LPTGDRARILYSTSSSLRAPIEGGDDVFAESIRCPSHCGTPLMRGTLQNPPRSHQRAAREAQAGTD